MDAPPSPPSPPAQTLYPYRQEDYQHLHIVGHLFQNGQYLPVKVFVAPAMAESAQQSYWRQQSEQQGRRKGFWRGVLVGLLPFVVMVLVVLG
jgi:hypothetical protein